MTELENIISKGEEDPKQGLTLLSHDIFASLNGIFASLSLVDPNDVSENANKHIKRARTSALMLREVLELALNIENTASKLENSDEPVNVQDELDLLSNIWRVQLNEVGERFTIIAPQTAIMLKSFDRVSFHRILNNIISNSWKHSEKTSITITVKLIENQKVEIRISDEGKGLSQSALDNLFQFRGKPQDSTTPGSGLGLYIVKNLVQNMGGTITIVNAPSGGAEACLILPALNGEYVHDVDSSNLPDLSHLNILLAEDNVTNQLVVTKMLESMGARFSVASDGIEALELVDKNDFDIVLLDIEMPRKSGLEVLHEIRARNDAKANMPLIAFTAYVMSEHKDRIYQAGANGVIAKPIEGINKLGRSILKYVHGDNNVAMDSDSSSINTSTVDGSIGYIAPEIFDSLKQSISEDVMPELLDRMRHDMKDIQTNLIQSEAAADYDSMRMASHTLISLAGAIGAVNLQKTAEDLNVALHKEDSQNRQFLNMLCISGISDVLTVL